MASLQSSCTVLTTIPNHRISSFPNTLSSHLPANARRSHRFFRVTCNEPSETDGRRVDRRNMLLGLGGLYGAANLISDPRALGEPMPPPNLSTCSTAYDLISGDALDAKCCPPLPDTIVDYTLPPVGKLRVRPPAHRLNPDNKDKYEEAIRRMRALDITDPSDPRGFTQQANIHCAYCNGAYDQLGFNGKDIAVHFSWLFFPFHRWYLYFYERILGDLICDPTFSLPFWNWDNPRGMQLPKIFDYPHSPLYNVNRNPCHRPPAVVDLSNKNDGADDRQKISNNLSIMYNEMIRSVHRTYCFMGQPFCAGEDAPGAARGGTVERGSHTSIHLWVGDPKNKYHEDLGNFYSAGRDPAFFCHHGNVDRLWTIWENLKTWPDKQIKNPNYLNATFLFYDENKQMVRVKVADCLDHRKMGYEYEKVDIPWLNYRPPRRVARARSEDVLKGAKHPDTVFPLTLTNITKVVVSKTTRGQADEVLVVEDVQTDPRKNIKFDVYVNDEDDNPGDVGKAEYAGTFAQLPHRSHSKTSKGSIELSLKELYEDIDIGEEDDTVVVTIVPRYNGQDVTIGGIKIIKAAAADISAA